MSLLLIVALASFVHWIIGCLDRLVIQHHSGRLPTDCLGDSGTTMTKYLNSVLKA